jgi:anti-sigma B factor antagonist
MAARHDTPPRRLRVSAFPADGGRFRVAIGGELDIASVEQVRAALAAVIAQSPSVVLVDLDELTFMDSTGISALVAAHREASAAGVVLAVVNSRGIVRRVLELTGTLRQLSGSEPDGGAAPDGGAG